MTRIITIMIIVLALLATRKGVPLRYNMRNLMLRWKTTLVVVLAFTLVVGVLTVMLGLLMG